MQIMWSIFVPKDVRWIGFMHLEFFLLFSFFFPMDDMSLSNMPLILGADMNVNVSNKTHMTYNKPLALTVK
jgi:hypothetical protein